MLLRNSKRAWKLPNSGTPIFDEVVELLQFAVTGSEPKLNLVSHPSPALALRKGGQKRGTPGNGLRDLIEASVLCNWVVASE